MEAADLGKEVKIVKSGKCPFCGKLVSKKDFKDKPKIYLKEFKISGICYSCQNDIFK